MRTLLDVFHQTRLKVWAQQPDEFFAEARLDMDGTLVSTSGECKQGMDISYQGSWGYHPLVVTLANTGEVLSIVNRSGNRPSHEGCPEEVDQALDVCLRGGFRRVLLRGDTDFTQTRHLDRWSDDPRVRFIFGADATPRLHIRADDLEKRRVLRMEFKTFLNAFLRLPCQIVHSGRRLIYRLLGWNPHLGVFFRLVDRLHN